MVSEPALAKAGDEARVGQKNGLTYQWASKGERPRQPKNQRYESAYIFGAICPARGLGAALVMPYANTEAMNGHLAEIALNVAPGAHAVVLIDGAGWHTSKMIATPTNITLGAWCPRRRRARLSRRRYINPSHPGKASVLAHSVNTSSTLIHLHLIKTRLWIAACSVSLNRLAPCQIETGVENAFNTNLHKF